MPAHAPSAPAAPTLHAVSNGARHIEHVCVGAAFPDTCTTCGRELDFDVPVGIVGTARKVTDRYVTDLCIAGDLPAQRFGSVWRIREDWRAWVAKRSAETIEGRRHRLEEGKQRKRKAAAEARIRIAKQEAEANANAGRRDFLPTRSRVP